jgi:glycyl-tRNA synthetase beta chain
MTAPTTATTPTPSQASAARADLLLEIGCEEIPAGFLARALGEWPALAAARLGAARLEQQGIACLGTPRRLTLIVRGLAAQQPDVTAEITGPPAKAGFDAAGRPTKAAIGFAQKNGVGVDAIRTVELPGKGAYLVVTRREVGVATTTLLPGLLAELIREIPWKKSMRWAGFDEAFVRPVHWIVALYGGEVVPLSILGVKSGRESRGHRFLAPQAIALAGSEADYKQKLRQAFVIVDPAARRTMIEAELGRVAEEERVAIRLDSALLDEVVNLVEYPQAVGGSFGGEFLEVPAEVIVSAMRAHQRYFATEKDGRLAPRFITVAGTVTRDVKVVRAGNERVLGARLSDARFFFREDRAVGLGKMAERLGGVVFQKDLGTVGEKVERLGRHVAARALAGDAAAFDRARALCKADLLSKMVGEFPDLQGIMGGHYARLAGEPEAVASAIVEHYLPRSAADGLPKTAAGAALGIADRMDTIVGCFAVGLRPTGSADAFGLRRATLAVLNLLLARSWRTPLSTLVDEAAAALAGKIRWNDERRAEVLEFFRGRLRGLLCESRGLAADAVDAALAAGALDVPDAAARAQAVSRLRDRPDFEPLAVAFKRVANILRSDGGEKAGEPDVGRLVHPSERALWQAFSAARGRVGTLLGERAYDQALAELASLKPAVDRFFDDVLVMDKDPGIKQNRLALLGAINSTFLHIADFRQLAVE